jgi:hypothetical protein
MNVSQLLARMTDPDEEARAEASEELNLLMDDDVVRALLEIVAGPASEEIRADAVIALGPILEEAGMDYDVGVPYELDPEFGPGISQESYETLVHDLRALYDDEAQPKLIRRRAFEVLVRDPRGWQAEDIRRHFAGADEDWKLTAVFAMGYIAGFEKEIAATLKSAEGLMLVEAVRSAGAQGVPAAAKRIGDLAMDEDADTTLRLVAIAALSNVHKNSEEILQELLESDDEDIAEAAEAALEEVSMGEGWDGDEEIS